MSAAARSNRNAAYSKSRRASIATEISDPTSRVARVHGLFIAVEYLDLTKSETPSLSDARSNNPSCLGPEPHSNIHSWLVIQEVMNMMNFEWENLKGLVVLQISEIDQLHDECRNSKGLLEAGLFAFEKAITGTVPRDFCSIFALHCLSFALYHSLPPSPVEGNGLRRGMPLDNDELWQNALQSRDHLQTPIAQRDFKTASNFQWPEPVKPLPNVVVRPSEPFQAPATAHHFNPDYQHSQGHSQELFLSPHSNINPGSSNGITPSTSGSFINTQHRFASTTDVDHLSGIRIGIQPTQFSAPGLHEELKSVSGNIYPPDLVGITGNIQANLGAFPLETLRNEDHSISMINGPLGTYDNSALLTNSPNVMIQGQHYLAVEGQLPEASVSDEELRETPLFLKILAFLDHLKSFLLELSVQGLTVKQPHEKISRENINHIIENFIKSLNPTKKCKRWIPPCQAVVSVATKLLDRGCFSGVDEVRKFIVWFGEIALETNPPAYDILRQRVTTQVTIWKDELQLQRSRPPGEQVALRIPLRQQGLSPPASTPGISLNGSRKHRFSCKNCHRGFTKGGNLKRHEGNPKACNRALRPTARG